MTDLRAKAVTGLPDKYPAIDPGTASGTRLSKDMSEDDLLG
jgi:hypothetical protein